MGLLRPSGSEGHGFHIALPNSPAAASLIRKQTMRFLRHFPLHRQLIDDIEAVVGEALANAAEHGFRIHGTIRLDASLNEEALEVTVSDDGTGFAQRGPISADHPPPHSPRGYGLFLMRALVDEIEFRDAGKTVWFRKRLRPD